MLSGNISGDEINAPHHIRVAEIELTLPCMISMMCCYSGDTSNRNGTTSSLANVKRCEVMSWERKGTF